MPVLGSTDFRAQFWVDDFGAKGDGSTNDTAAIQAAMDAADAAGGGTVNFSAAKTYIVSSAPRTDRGGRAQLAFKQYSLAGAAGPPIVFEGNGATLKSTVTGLSYSAPFGCPSVIGGPTKQSANAFTQIDVTIRNITVQVPANSTICGIDLDFVVRATIGPKTQVNTPTVTTQPTNIWTFGLRMPRVANYGESILRSGGAFGQYCGIVANTEHTRIDQWFNKWNVIGYAPRGDAGFHASSVSMLSSEWCTYHLAHWDESLGLSNGDGNVYLNILLDIEDAAGGNWFSTNATNGHIRDTSGYFYGQCRFLATTGTARNAILAAAPNLKLLSMFEEGVAYPPNTLPSVPASGTAFPVLYADKVYYFSGGTVSAITVGGNNIGVTTGAIVVPAGQALIVTYTAAPTLNAVLPL